MPPRRSFLMRHVALREPDEITARKYLRIWHSRDLYNKPHQFPHLTSQVLFGNDRPLELEIGCSTGEYICSLAGANHSRNYLGIEINLKSLYVAVHNASEGGLDNILFVKAPVQDTYRLLQPNSLQAVYMHFPDPSLHPKYRKRRLLTPVFLHKLHDILVSGGIFSFITDKEELFREVLPLLDNDPRFEKTHPEPFLQGFEPLVKSRYQLYWERHEGIIFRVELRNVKPASDDSLP